MPYIIYLMPSGQRAWFVGTDSRVVNNSPVQYPRFDDEKSKEVSLEFAQDAKRRWLQDFGISVRIAAERYGRFIDEGDGACEQDSRVAKFVPINGLLGLIVMPGTVPSGKVWFARAIDVPAFKTNNQYQTIESVQGETAEAAAKSAAERWGTGVLFADPQAAVLAARQARERAEQEKNRQFVNLRPADRGPR